MTMAFSDVADFILGGTEVPEDALYVGATLLIDTLGVAAGATPMQAGRLARAHAVRFHCASDISDRATLLFDGRSASIPGASFAAATATDNLDAHDGYNPTKGHIGCAVVPALCALAEHMPDLSGRDALTALVIAYEVSACAAIALHSTVEDYHTSGAWNALGVAALGARLRGHTRDQLRHGLGIAEYHGPRSQMMREIANPTMLHDGSGMGALVGTMATLMAEDGFTGAPAITVEAENVAPYWTHLRDQWTVKLNYVKPYPICRWAHAALDALDGLMRAHSLSPDTVARIEVRTFAEAAALYPGMPETTSQAQYSLHFALGTLLVNEAISPAHIEGNGLRDPRVAAQIAKIAVVADGKHSDRFPNGRWSDVTVHTVDGRQLHSGDTHAKGGPEAPMPLDEVEAKFHIMAAGLPEARRTAIWDMRSRLQERGTHFADLLTLLHPALEVT